MNIVNGHNGGPSLDDDASAFGDEGFIKISRAMRYHPFVGCGHPVAPADPSRGAWSRNEAWGDLIANCRYKSGFVMNKGRMMEIKPGQLLGAVSWLASRWNWTPKTVRWYLDRLEELGMIARATPETISTQNENYAGARSIPGNGMRKGNQINVLSVCNYEIYQYVSEAQGQAQGQAHGKRTASARQESKKERREEDIKEKKTLSSVSTDVSADDDLQMREIVALYNSTAERCGLACVRFLSDKRKKHLRARMKDHSIDDWRLAMTNLERSAFLCGKTPRSKWKADFDFFLQPDKLAKCIEGGYGNGLHRNPDTAEAYASYAALWKD